jgi:hypothetical protein
MPVTARYRPGRYHPDTPRPRPDAATPQWRRSCYLASRLRPRRRSMASKPASTLPVINIAPWLENDHKGRLSSSAAIHAACLEYGFFYLDIAAVADPAEPDELGRLAREFFALPQDQKDALALANQDHARGACAAGEWSEADSQRTAARCRLPAPQGERHERARGQSRGARLLPPCLAPGQDAAALGREPVAGRARLPRKVRGVDHEDAAARPGRNGGVRVPLRHL